MFFRCLRQIEHDDILDIADIIEQRGRENMFALIDAVIQAHDDFVKISQQVKNQAGNHE